MSKYEKAWNMLKDCLNDLSKDKTDDNILSWMEQSTISGIKSMIKNIETQYELVQGE